MNPRTLPLTLGAALLLVVGVLATSAWFDDQPSTALADIATATAPAASGPSERPVPRPTLNPVDPDELDIALQIDRTRAPLADVVEQFRARVAAQPADHITRTTLASTLLELARASADLDLYAEAEVEIDEALRLAPESTGAQLVKAQAESARHDFAASRARAQRLLDDDPNNLGALAARGDAAFELGDIDTARADFAQLHAAAPSAASLSRLARLDQLTGDQAGAIERSIEALRLAQDVPLRPESAAFYWFQLGSTLWHAGDVDSAAASLEQALTIEPTHPGSLELLAHVRTAQGRVEEAVDLYRYILTGGGAADIHGELSILLRLTGHPAEAEEEWRRGVELGNEAISTYPAERRHLAEFFVTANPAIALELAQVDLTTRQDIHSHQVLARALFANDRFEEADAAMRAALELGTIDAELYYDAGAIAKAVGDDARAGAFLRAAVDLNPAFDPVDAPRAVALLEQLDADG